MPGGAVSQSNESAGLLASLTKQTAPLAVMVGMSFAVPQRTSELAHGKPPALETSCDIFAGSETSWLCACRDRASQCAPMLLHATAQVRLGGAISQSPRTVSIGGRVVAVVVVAVVVVVVVEVPVMVIVVVEFSKQMPTLPPSGVSRKTSTSPSRSFTKPGSVVRAIQSPCRRPAITWHRKGGLTASVCPPSPMDLYTTTAWSKATIW
mmetsp:Transcript_54649/g.140688  ORF Transcript_54649/g.140688 Transcript_54649/m.140688 type:complete len:208 (-) Transcript_54649:459-1082(-)